MKVLVIAHLLSLTLLMQPEPVPLQYSGFTKYLTRHFKFPESAKKNCEWHYLMIKVNVDATDKVVSYECLNTVDAAEVKQLDALLNFRFPKSDHLNHHPLLFMFSLNKSEICDYQLPYRVYSPNDAINVYARYAIEELKKTLK